MKHLRKFEKYTTERKKNEIIKESVLQVNDIYKVRTFVDIPQSLVNSYVKKVKDAAGKNLRQFFGDVDIAEEIVKYINLNFLNVDKIPADALMGGNEEVNTSTTQETTPSNNTETSDETTIEPSAETEPEVKVETEVQPSSEEKTDEFEEVGDGEKKESSEEDAKKSEKEEETSEEPSEETQEGTEELPS